jgi:hypothetical protein
MDSFKFFSAYEYLIVLGLILIAFFFIIIGLIRSKHKEINQHTKSKIKQGIIQIVISIIIILIAEISYYFIEKSHTGLFKAVSMLTSKPFVILSVALLLTGEVILILGIFKVYSYKKNLKKNSEPAH